MLIRTENVDDEMSLCPGITMETGDVEDKPRKLLEDSTRRCKSVYCIIRCVRFLR